MKFSVAHRFVHIGAFGEVRMCVHRESTAQRAVKVLRKSHMDEEEKRMLFNEINILKEIVSPNLFAITAPDLRSVRGLLFGQINATNRK